MVLPLRYDCFRHAQPILNYALSWVHAPETTAVSSSWKKTPIGIGVSVSKVYVTFCGAAAKLRATVTVEVPRSHTQLDRQAHTGRFRMRDQLVA